jgi:uracil-DNA glycosylase family 4
MEQYTVNNYLCQKCGMWKTSNTIRMIGRGDQNSKLLLLGEAPGFEENKAGMPFVGASGKMLQYYLDQIGISCFIGNAIKCWPTDESGGNRTPTPKEIDYCRAFTLEIINEIKPRVIVTLGRIALQQLVKIGLSMESARGKKIYIPELDAIVIPTYHPAYLMRVNDNLLLQHFVNDLVLAKQTIDLPSQRKMKATPRTLSDPLEIQKYLEELVEVPSFAFDLETQGFNHRDDRITDISFCHTVGQGVHIQWGHILEFEDLFRKVMSSNNEKIAHNFSFELSFLMQLGFKVNKPLFDTMLAYHTLNMSSEGDVGNSLYKLETLSWIMSSEGGYKDILSSFGGIGEYQSKEEVKEIQGQLWNPDDFESIEKGVVTDYDRYLYKLRTQIESTRKDKLKELGLTPLQYYSAMDSDVTYRLYKIMKPQIDSNYSDVFYNIVMRYCYSLTNMTLNGIKLDFEYIDKIARQNESEIDKIKTKIFNKIGYEFNLNSSKEISNLMYNVLGLQPNRNYVTKKGRNPSGDEEAITFFSKQKPILKSVLDYRGLTKQNSTYLVGFKNKSDKLTHRIYPSYFQLTATGRASCFLHTMPRDNKIRNMICAEKGNKLLLLDQSQIELRVLAMMSNDIAMINAFASGHDFHTYTACIMFNIPFDSFDKKKPEHDKARSSAKAINFGIVFGILAKSLAEDLGITELAALDFMNKFFSTYPNVKKFIQENEMFVQQYGYVETLYGRKRYLSKARSSNDIEKGKALRQSSNTRIQSSANDITAIGVSRCQEWLENNPQYRSMLVATIHDSIIVECPEKYTEELVPVFVNCMTKDIPKVTMPLKVDVDIQDVWTK